MDTQNLVTLGVALLAAATAVWVPTWTFKRTLELEHVKWMRDQRSQLYIDMLTEAYAEKQWHLHLMTEHELHLIGTRDGDEPRVPRTELPPPPNLRLGDVERARLGARSAAFASGRVIAAFNAFNGVLARTSLLPPRTEGDAHMAKIRADELFAALEKAIRDELGATKPDLPAQRH
ncbi:hypothetical protein [Micromonospora sp. NBC_00421]|uniref:hypothetical protein n=1 Tax=Micromonospora sp. NBC_00421 TaxID=2975976 RepID=UPI002E1F1BDC